MIVIVLTALCPFPALADRPAAAKPALEMQRTATKLLVGAGGSTTLFYRVENTGNVPLAAIRVTDTICGSVGEIATLESGESRSFTIQITVTKPCASQPTVSWLYQGLTYEKTLEPLAIAPARNDLALSLTASEPSVMPGQNVALSLRIENAGNTDIRSITVWDAILGELGALDRALAPGESAEFGVTAKVLAPTQYRFTVRGRSSSGEDVLEASNAVDVGVLPTDAVAKVTLNVEPESVRVSRPGEVSFTMTLENETSKDIRDVEISEMNAGPLRELAVLPPGITTIVCPCEIAEDGELQFLAEMATDDKSWRVVLSEEIPVSIGPGGVEPNEEGEGELSTLRTPKTLKEGRSAYPAFLYGGLGFLLLALLGVAVNAMRRRRRKRRRRDARVRRMRKMRQSARMDEVEWVKTRPHKPVGGSGGEE